MPLRVLKVPILLVRSILRGSPNLAIFSSAVHIGSEHIKANQTTMIIGKVIELFLPEDCLDDKGNLDLNRAKTVALSGLDSYHATEMIQRMPYARVSK